MNIACMCTVVVVIFVSINKSFSSYLCCCPGDARFWTYGENVWFRKLRRRYTRYCNLCERHFQCVFTARRRWRETGDKRIFRGVRFCLFFFLFIHLVLQHVYFVFIVSPLPLLCSQPVGWGSTYQAHPTALACGYEVLKHILEHDIVREVKNKEACMHALMSDIVSKHKSVRQARCVGLFGCFDLQTHHDGRMVQQLHEAMPEQVQLFKRELLDRGIYGLFRPPLFHCAPPLTISESELHDAFQRIDSALDVLDSW